MRTKHLNRNKQQLKTGWGKASKTNKGKKHIDNTRNKNERDYKHDMKNSCDE